MSACRLFLSIPAHVTLASIWQRCASLFCCTSAGMAVNTEYRSTSDHVLTALCCIRRERCARRPNILQAQRILLHSGRRHFCAIQVLPGATLTLHTPYSHAAVSACLKQWHMLKLAGPSCKLAFRFRQPLISLLFTELNRACNSVEGESAHKDRHRASVHSRSRETSCIQRGHSSVRVQASGERASD